MNVVRNIILFHLILVPWFSIAQVQYHYNQDIAVVEGENLLTMPWAGGLNTPQYNEMDIDEDGVLDLVLFNRDNNKFLTFIKEDVGYRYQPEYEHFFPEGLKHWALLRDYNCDGKLDIFTSSIFGMSLYENVTEQGGFPAWELVYETVFTKGLSGQINLQINSMDLPGIQDVDGDGDLDIFSFNFATGGGVHFHKNWSVERTGSCGMDLERVTEKYGDWQECTCEEYIFGDEECFTGGRLQHAGGKSVNSFDYGNQGVQDLVIGQETCTYIGFLENVGTIETPLMTSVDFDFPNTLDPVTLDYPSVFNLDVNSDGDIDIIATNNMFIPDGLSDYTANNWYYEKEGQEYYLVSKSYFQDQMLDVGYAAAPALSDMDDDGDEDLLIGSGSQGDGARLYLYENDGDALNPRLILSSTDYLQLSGKNFNRIRPQFIDLNQNNRDDLVVYQVGDGQQTSEIFWNTGNPIEPYSESNSELFVLPTIGINTNLHLFYSGNKFRLFAGREAGGLSYYINQATVANPQWELISENYLDIEDDFTARNINVVVSDINEDGKEDLIRYDDSGIMTIYLDFANGASLVQNIIQDKVSLLGYSSSFGTNVKLATTRITGSQLPSIMVGQWTGGLQLLSNIESTQQNISVDVRISVFPNPVNKEYRLSLLPNQDVEITITDTWGHQVMGETILLKNQVKELEINDLNVGLYIIRAGNSAGNIASFKFIVSE